MQIKFNIENLCLPVRNDVELEKAFNKIIVLQKSINEQLKDTVQRLQKNIFDRRLVIATWNPLEMKDNKICLIQFYAANGKLSVKIYQRITDKKDDLLKDYVAPMILFTYMVCHIVCMPPHAYIHVFSDVEEWENIDGLLFPRLSIIDDCIDAFDKYHIKSFKLNFNDKSILSSNINFGDSYSNKDKIEERQYLQLVRDVMEYGIKCNDRTGTGTMSLFGPELTFSLTDYTLPLLTTKHVFYRGIIEELLWFIRGSTDSNELNAKKVHIWDANGSKEFLERCGLGHRAEGDLGPVYGFQWRHFGATYVDKDFDYFKQGFDQLNNVVDILRSGKDNGKAVIVAWNPTDLPKMVLPPCHCLVQFVLSDGVLSCYLYQRSADLGLGVPFNIASYSILTLMLCHVLNLHPGRFVHTMGDAHVYINHIDILQKEQLNRTPRPFPRLQFKRPVSDIEDFEYGDFEIVDYNPHPKVVLPFSL